MRRNCYQRLLLGLGLLLAALAGGTHPAFPRALEEGEGLVMAFYYASYGLSSWSQDLCDFPEDLYDSSISEVIDRHIHQAQDAGLDAFIQAWQGPSISQNPSETNLRILLERADALNFEVAVLADVTSELLGTSGMVKEALIVLRDELALQSAYLRVNGRPVVFFRGHDRLALSAWQSLRSEVDPAHTMIWVADSDSTSVLATFDGLYLYDVQQTLQMSSLLKNQGEEVRWWNFTNDESAYWAATVIPGYDDAYLVEDEDDQLERDRNAGRYYRQNFEAATASDPDWIVIRSFNEWTHCTQIEPSGTYASTYLDITADLIETYRQSLVPDTPTPTLEATEAAPSAMPTDTPEPTIAATTQPVTATTTITPTATLTPTRTPTLTPSATPFRLATPTPTRTLVPGETRRPAPTGTWRPGATAAPLVTRAPGVVVPTFTPVPRLPVEGYPSNRCSLLPLLLPAVALLLQRRSRRRE